MWKLVKLGFGLLFLAIAIHGNDTLEQQKKALRNKLKGMANRNEPIYGKFQPLQELGPSAYSVVFKGQLVSDSETIFVMKFIPADYYYVAEYEMKIYGELNPERNQDIERFGIPFLYYYSKWEGYMLTIISYFEDGDLVDRLAEFKESTGINGLILFREFVLQTKYLHSCNIRHNDIKPENIMLQNHRSFLIDFDYSTKMNEDKPGGTFNFLSRRYIRGEKRNALDDYESFLYTMCWLYKVHLKWFGLHDNYKNEKYLKEMLQMSQPHRENTQNTIAEIKKTIKSEPLKRVFLKFANETFRSDSRFPDYDGLYDFIDREIKGFSRPWFTWLTKEQVKEAEKNPLPDIRKEIADPETSIALIR